MSTVQANGRAATEAALEYTERFAGAITICLRNHGDGNSRGKVPFGERWQHKDWTPDEIESVYETRGAFNVGVRFGPQSRVIDIETDSPEEEALLAELLGDDPPVGPCFSSGRGGHHLYRWSDELRAIEKAVHKYRGKLGVRLGNAGGAHSVFPPSIHHNGRQYTWLVGLDEADVPELPPSAVQKLLADANGKSDKAASNGKPHTATDGTSSANVGACIAAMRRAKVQDKGDGSTRLYACACRCVEHDLTDAQAIEAVRQYAAEFPFPRSYSDAEIVQRVRDAERKTTRGKATAGTTRRKIDTSLKDLSLITPQAWAALQAANEPPTMFRYGGVPSRLESGDRGQPIIRALEFTRMRHHLARAAKFVEWKKAGDNLVEKATIPPEAVVNDVLATPDQPLPVFARIVEAPVFAADGTLQTLPGYHDRSQTYYVPADGFEVPEVPERPTGQDIESARLLLCDELLGEFPYVTDAERAHAVALLLLPFARDLIAGATPLHLIEKPSPGTGATLLIEMLALPAIGREIPAMTEGRDEEEWRKRITAKLMTGSPFLLIDNLRRRLDCAAVSSAITAPAWEDRILGGSTMASLSVRCAWVATGNNPAVSTEIARRCVRIRLDARMDRPWLRDGFRHPDLRTWAMENRGLLTWAALTLIRAWLCAGRPPGSQVLGMFENWSKVMGGILAVGGVPGFLSNLAEFYEESDAEGTNWRGFLSLWWERCGTEERKVVDLLPVAIDACLPLGVGSEQSQRVVLGKMLADRRDRVFDLEIEHETWKVVIQRGKQSKRSYQWHLRASHG